MSNRISPIIKPEELVLLSKENNIILVDARAGSGAREKYNEKHLSGARFVDLEDDLIELNTNPANGGRHPLPDPEKFSGVLKKLNINPESHVIVYDDKNGANAAARFWWMMRAVGHKKIQVLDGGFNAAISAGFPADSEIENVESQQVYPAKKWILPLIKIDEVEQKVKIPNYVVIDVRDSERYHGEKEPIDLIAGHIPGAINIPFTENLSEKGLFLSPQELKNKYFNQLQNRASDQIIVHCGSGVTACHTLLAMDYAGLGIPVLYVGSWSEWSRTDRPIATNF